MPPHRNPQERTEHSEEGSLPPVQPGTPPRDHAHYASLSFKVPLSFHTDIRDVIGSPDEVKEMVRKGEIIPAGKGSRWV